MHNFRPFFGRNEIDLTVSKEKPIILIKAMNDVGKTSIFNAFIWCLYGGSTEENFGNINWKAHKKGDGRTYVKLIFDHDGKQYEIQRSLSFRKQTSSSFDPLNYEVEIRIDGKYEKLESIDRANNFIKEILPKDASQFFFFDGEKIQQYTEVRAGDDVKNAIQIVLGIKELLNAEDDLRNIYSDLRRELNQLLAKNKRAKEEALKNEELGKRIDGLREKIPILDEQIINCQKTIESCDQTLNRHSAIQEKVEKRKEEEKREKDLMEKLERNLKEQLLARQDIPFLLISPLLERLEEMGEEVIADWKKNAIVAIMNSGSNRCICDRPLGKLTCPKCHTKVGPDVEKKFQDKMDKMDECNQFSYLGSFSTTLLRKKEPKLIEKKIYDLAENSANLESSLGLCRIALKKLREEIGGKGDYSQEIAHTENLRDRAKDSIKNYNDQIVKLKIDLGIMEKEYSKKQKELVNKTGSNEDVSRKNKHLNMCQLSIEGYEYAIEELVENTATRVAELASKTFLQLTNAPRLYEGLEITEDYEITIRTRGGTTRPVWEQAPGAGQRQVIAISFIAALNAFTARDAPIVIDTPISRLDPVHKKNLINYYPKMGPQTIILYQPNELGDEEIENIQGSIISEWELERDPSDPKVSIIIPMRGT